MLTEPFQLPRYFDANPSTWDIADYLDLLGNLSYDVAVSRWLRSLEFIANDPGQTRLRQERAQHLHDRYNNSCVSILSFLFCTNMIFRGKGALGEFLASLELGFLAPELGPGKVFSFP